MSSKDNCTKGYSCGYACIAKSKQCKGGVGAESNLILSNYYNLATGGKVLGSGSYGTAYLTAKGTVAKVLHEGNKFSDLELPLQKLMGDAGYSAKLLNSDSAGTSAEMEYLSGYKVAQRGINKAQLDKLAEGLGYLHKNGYSHLDLHEQNVLVDDKSNDAKLIDFGMAKKLDADSVYDDLMSYKDLANNYGDGLPDGLIKNTLEKIKNAKKKQYAKYDDRLKAINLELENYLKELN